MSGDSAARAIDLVKRAAKLEAFAHRILARSRDLNVEADELRRTVRPILPTVDQLEGIPIAVERIHSGAKSESHHGDECAPGPLPRSVTWSSGHGGPRRVMVDHLSPMDHRGGRLWAFTDAEVESILATVRGAGGVILHHWTHDHGISVEIALEPGIGA